MPTLDWPVTQHTLSTLTSGGATYNSANTTNAIGTIAPGITGSQLGTTLASGQQIALGMLYPNTYAGRFGVIFLHGAGAGAAPIFNVDTRAYADSLVHAGFVVLSVDTGTGSWGNALGQETINRAYAYLQSMINPSGSPALAKIGIMGHSMGAASGLTWIKNNASKVACAWFTSPLTDVEALHFTADRQASGGATGYLRTAQWQVLSTDANASLHTDTLWSSTVKRDNCRLLDAAYLVRDGLNTYGSTNPRNQVYAGATEYEPTEWTANAITPGWMDASRNPAAWRGLGVPIRIGQALLDPQAPYQMQQWWVNAVNDPLVTLRPIVTYSGAGHNFATWGVWNATPFAPSGLTDNQILAAGGLPRREVRDFFWQYLR